MKPFLVILFLCFANFASRATESAPNPPDSSFTTGSHTVLEILAQFPDLPSTFTHDQLASSVSAMCSYFHDSSYGKLTLVPTVSHYYTLPHPSGYYATNGRDVLKRDMQIAASGDYGDQAKATYDHIIYWFPKIAIGFSAWAQIPGNTIWANGVSGSWPLCHEMGHNLGLGHAHKWIPCNLNNPVDPCGKSAEYGDGFDTMGSEGQGRDFNPWEKRRVHWLADAKIKAITASGTYRIPRFDSPAAADLVPFALTIPQPNTGRTYCIFYRHSLNTTTGGACVGWYTNVSWWLIDHNPPTPGLADAVVPVGGTLRDNGLVISTVAIGGSEPNYWTDVKITVP